MRIRDYKNTYIGIDPGLDGAVVIMKDKEIFLWTVPTVDIIKSNNKKGKEYLENSMAAYLEPFYNKQNCHVFLEKVGAMPKQGVTSMFKFGTGYGLWKGIIAAYHIPCTLITPQAWKKSLMQGMKDKDASLIRAQQLFPQCAGELMKKKDIGKADALLLCEHGRRLLHSGGR